VIQMHLELYLKLIYRVLVAQTHLENLTIYVYFLEFLLKALNATYNSHIVDLTPSIVDYPIT